MIAGRLAQMENSGRQRKKLSGLSNVTTPTKKATR
jgi:hypothetical protein